ncbi:MAG: uroporphyrinogen decarboxylase family protein, partial [Spirochaetota bacterium]
MALEEPDRVPVFCQLSLGHYMLNAGREPYRVWFSPEDFAASLGDLARRYDFDGVLVNLPGRPPGWEGLIASMERLPGARRIDWQGGGSSLCPDADNVHYQGGARRPGLDEIDPDILYFIEPHGITEVTYPFSFDFAPPNFAKGPSFFPPYFLDTLKLAVRDCGEELHVSSELPSPFTQMMELLGYSEGLLALMDDPGKCERILASLAEGTAELAILQSRAGADAILVSSAFASGGFLSLDHYRRFVLPFEKAVTERVHRETRTPIYVHTCGAIGDRIGAMVEAGFDGIDTMDPPPLGNTDIAKVKEEFGERIFLKGNLDPVNLLLNGSVEAIRGRALELVRVAGRG